MNTSCATCPKTLPDGHPTAACTPCTRDLRTWLAELPHHAALLPLLLVPGASPRTGQLRASRAHPPAPLRLDILDLVGPGHPVPPAAHTEDQVGRIPLAAWLTGWAHHIAGQHPAVTRDQHGTQIVQRCEQAWPTWQGIDGWCRWLTAYLPAITADRDDARVFHHQLDGFVRHLRGLTGAGPNRQPAARLCPSCDTLTLVQTEWDDLACTLCGGEFATAHREQTSAAA